MNYLAPIIILVALAAITLFFVFLRKKKKADDAWKQDISSRAINIINTTPPVPTPKGHKVYFEAGASQASFSLTACDVGIEHTFQKGECAGYAVDRSQFHISIVVLNSEPDSQGDPAYKVFIHPGNPYFGSEWDKRAGQGEEVDHYILAAAQMVAVGQPLGEIIVVPHHVGMEDHLARVCEYELEHCVLAFYDGPKFEDTKTHGQGQGHPLIAEC